MDSLMRKSATSIAEALASWQTQLIQKGSSLEKEVAERYVSRWTSPALSHVMKIRTALVLGLEEYLASEGLVNIDRVTLSPVTDPLCHGVEHVPVISYQNVPYRTTHSMIYSKFLACMSPHIPGVFIDSPNIRLELPSSDGSMRKKYLIDFSQMDIERRRYTPIASDGYFRDPETVIQTLQEDRDRALDFFEDLIIHAVKKVRSSCLESLKALGVALDVPQKPFPRFFKDEWLEPGESEKELEKKLGRIAGTQFFWVLGLLRENYDLVYPFLKEDASIPESGAIKSRQIFNYDLCAAAKYLDGSLGDAWEVLSGGLREWFFPAIIARLLANNVLHEAPIFDGKGNITNLDRLDGYGPFLLAASMKDSSGEPIFPQTFGGGLGIERSLFALLQGPEIHQIEEITYFGKNPDIPGPFLF